MRYRLITFVILITFGWQGASEASWAYAPNAGSLRPRAAVDRVAVSGVIRGNIATGKEVKIRSDRNTFQKEAALVIGAIRRDASRAGFRMRSNIIGITLGEQMTLGIYDIVENACEHGNRYDPNKYVTIRWVIKDGRLICSVSDEGKEFTGASFWNAVRENPRGPSDTKRGFSIQYVASVYAHDLFFEPIAESGDRHGTKINLVWYRDVIFGQRRQKALFDRIYGIRGITEGKVQPTAGPILLNHPVQWLPLPARHKLAICDLLDGEDLLKGEGIKTVYDLVQRSEGEIRLIPGMEAIYVTDIKIAIYEQGWRLRPDIDRAETEKLTAFARDIATAIEAKIEGAEDLVARIERSKHARQSIRRLEAMGKDVADLVATQLRAHKRQALVGELSNAIASGRVPRYDMRNAGAIINGSAQQAFKDPKNIPKYMARVKNNIARIRRTVALLKAIKLPVPEMDKDGVWYISLPISARVIVAPSGRGLARFGTRKSPARLAADRLIHSGI